MIKFKLTLQYFRFGKLVNSNLFQQTFHRRMNQPFSPLINRNVHYRPPLTKNSLYTHSKTSSFYEGVPKVERNHYDFETLNTSIKKRKQDKQKASSQQKGYLKRQGESRILLKNNEQEMKQNKKASIPNFYQARSKYLNTSSQISLRPDKNTESSTNFHKKHRKNISNFEGGYESKQVPIFLLERERPVDKYTFPHKKSFSRKIKLDDFHIGKCKGKGRFGKVYLVRHKQTGYLLALKKVNKQMVSPMLDQFINEIKLQQYISHPCVVKIYGYFSDETYFYILLEYMEEGSLYSLLKRQKSFAEPFTARVLYQACRAIKFMHDLDIIHRDIKPENIVVSNNVFKICDFGWAAFCSGRRETYCGTLDYVCPEILQGKAYGKNVDIWCLGVLVYQMLVGKTPFYDINRKKTKQKILNYQIQPYPNYISPCAKSFIDSILQQKNYENISIEDLLHHPFFDQSKKVEFQ